MTLRTRTSSARLAGITFLFYIATGIAGMLSTLVPGESLRGAHQLSVFTAEQLRS